LDIYTNIRLDAVHVIFNTYYNSMLMLMTYIVANFTNLFIIFQNLAVSNGLLYIKVGGLLYVPCSVWKQHMFCELQMLP